MTTPLPIEDGVFYRTHHRNAQFGPEYARSSPVTATSAPERPGYSCFRNPHELGRYMIEMGWIGDPLVDWDQHAVYRFRGAEIGRGADNEPLAMPLTSTPDEVMTWNEFQQRLGATLIQMMPRSSGASR